MKCSVTVVLFLLAVLPPVSSAAKDVTDDSSHIGDGFETGKYGTYARWTNKRNNVSFPENKREGGGRCLALNKGEAVVLVIKPVSVSPDQKYRISFLARVDGPGTLESNPNFAHLFFHHNKKKSGRDMAGWRLQFHDSNGKEIHREVPPFSTVIMSDTWQKYIEEIYPPVEAVSMRIIFKNGIKEDTLYVDDLECNDITEEKIININPDFSYGQWCYTGWNYVHKGQIVPSSETEDAFCLDCTDGWVVGDSIVVEGGKEYTLLYKFTGTNKERKATLRGEFSNIVKDESGKNKANKLGRTRKRISANYNKTVVDQYRFIVPTNATRMKIIFGNGILHYARLERSKPEIKLKGS